MIMIDHHAFDYDAILLDIMSMSIYQEIFHVTSNPF